MSVKNYDFLAIQAPVNITAKKVVSKGFSEEFINEDEKRLFSKEFLKIKKIPKNLYKTEFVDFTNYKYGSLTVIGLYEESTGIRARWVVRCSCGNYETRSTKAIKRHAKYTDEGNCCIECNDLKELRYLSSAKSMGLEYKEYCEKILNRKYS